MAFDPVLVGTTANDGTGDPLRTAFTRVNSNFGLAVEGPATATSGRVAVYDGATGKLLQDGIKAEADLVVGPATATSGRVAVYNGTTGKLLQDGAKLEADLVVGPASVTAGSVAAFNGTTGKLVQQGLGAGTAAAPSLAFAADSNTGLFNPSADTLAFSTGGAERVKVGSNGSSAVGRQSMLHVGVGATSPASNTFGTGNISASTNVYTVFSVSSHNDSAGNGNFLGFLRSRGTYASPIALSSGDLIGSIRADSLNDASAGFPYRTSASIEFFADANHATGDLPARITFSTAPVGSGTSSERMRITSAGNVGIGTTAPANLFQIAGALGLNNAAMFSKTTSGDFTITVSGLLLLTGAVWRQSSILVFYSGVNTGLGDPTQLLSIVRIQGLSTYSNISTTDIVGSASVAASSSTTTGVTLTFDVPDANFGSVYAVVTTRGTQPTLS